MLVYQQKNSEFIENPHLKCLDCKISYEIEQDDIQD